MDTTVRGIDAVVVAELRAAGYMESTVGQYAKTIKALTEFASGREYSTSLPGGGDSVALDAACHGGLGDQPQQRSHNIHARPSASSLRRAFVAADGMDG